MDEIRNPFAPSAGSQPPELAGRDNLIRSAEIAIQRILRGKHDRSQILLGLRGTGKTVLLNRIENIALENDHMTSFVEAPDDRDLAELLYPKIHQVLRKLSFIEDAKAKTHAALRSLRSFAGAFKITVGDVSISVDPQPGSADSGILEYDLIDLFFAVGEAAQAAGRAWTLLIDEVQYLSKAELSALIVAIHRMNQKGLPILFFGAGLPQIAALSGEAKSYAERLFLFPKIGALDDIAAADAIKVPIEEEEESITDDAIADIIKVTEGYPYFLQEWGFQVWNIAQSAPFTRDDVKGASINALRRLDEGFFRVRYDRLTPKEREYVLAMAELGDGPYKSSDIADQLGESVNTLGPRRAKIIHKGMIYSPEHGDVDFTVPMFASYLRRNFLDKDTS
jgi:hypothetical protein